MEGINGKVAVVTGGGNGIGRACAEKLAALGAKLVIADIVEKAGKQTAADLQTTGAEAFFFKLDAASPEQNKAMAEAAVDEFGSLDVLVTAAGMVTGGYKSGDAKSDEAYLREITDFAAEPTDYFFEMDLEAWQKLLDVNLTGTMLAIQSCAAKMRQAGGGSIVTISSAEGKRPHGPLIPYAVSKAGVIMLTKCLALNLSPANVRINSVGPGFTETNLTRAILDTEGLRDALASEIPMGRAGKPTEIANTVAFLASDSASFFTGETLHPAGGMYL